MMRSPSATFASTTSAERDGSPISSSRSRARLGAPPCSGPGEGAEGAHHAGAEVGAGRGDHPAGEGRGVEAVVGGEHEVGVDRPGLVGRRDLAGEHAQVVGGVAERRGRARSAASPWPRRWRAATRVGTSATRARASSRRAASSMSSMGRRPRAPPVRASPVASCDSGRRAGGGDGGEGGEHRRGQGPAGGGGGVEGLPLGGVGEVAEQEEVPHVLEAAGLGQLDGGVLAVVEEALGAADVADRGVGHDEALEPGRGHGGDREVGRSGAGRSGGARVSTGGGDGHDPTINPAGQKINLEYDQR